MTSPGLTAFPLADETASVTLNGSGNGQVSITPGQPARGGGVGSGRNSGLSWSVTAVAVSVATNVSEASCSVYVSYGIQAATQNEFQGQTATGSTGDTDTVTATLRPGDWITAVWSGGDPGSLATMRVYGTVTPPGVA
jgi:hypothetical protein